MSVLAASCIHAGTLFTVVDLGLFNGTSPALASSNAAGETVGGNGHAFVSNGSIVTDLGTLPGGTWSAAFGISASGAVVGYSDTAIPGQFLGFEWTSSNGMTALNTLGGLDSWAMAMSDSGEIAGSSIAPNGYMHAVVWLNGAIADLGTLGGTTSNADGINSAGTVVGSADAGSGSHAFLYSGGVMMDLNTMIAGSPGWVLTDAWTINNDGRITGLGTFNGASHMVGLDPAGSLQSNAPVSTPEPSTFVLLGIGLALAACRATIKAGWTRSPNRTKSGSGN